MTSTSLHYVRKTHLTDAVRHLRRYFAALLAGLTWCALMLFPAIVGSLFVNESWEVGAFYAAIFDWSSIQSAFLFGIYAFILSGSEGFIKAVKDTKAFQHAREYVRATVYMALALSAFCLPLLIIHPSLKISVSLSLGYIVFSTVVAMSVYVFCRFITVVRLFSILERSRKK